MCRARSMWSALRKADRRVRSQAFMFFVYPMALLPVMLAYGARYAFDSNVLVFLGLLAFAAALGAVDVLGRAGFGGEKRPNATGEIIMELSRTSGPGGHRMISRLDRVRQLLLSTLPTHFLR